MSHGIADSSSSRSIPRPILPPFLLLTTSQEHNGPSNRPGASKLTRESFSRAFHHIFFRRRLGTDSSLEKVAEATVEDENTVYSARASNSVNTKTAGRPTSRPSTTSVVSRSTASHISAPHAPRTLITSFPPLNVSDIPPRSPKNKSPFSAVLLAREDEELDEDDPALALWHTEQLHRARLAKLTSHLGEEIPAELVLSPVFLSNRSSRRGYHPKRKSLDPSLFRQVSSTEENLRRSQSLKEQGKSHRTLSVVGITTPEMPSTEHMAGEIRCTEATTYISNTAPHSSVNPETWHSGSLMNIPTDDVLHEMVLVDTCSAPLHFFRPSIETSRGVSPLFLHASHATPKPENPRGRPSTTDGGRRVEKLASFFGIGPDDASAVAHDSEAAQKLQVSSTTSSAAGDPAIGIHVPRSQLEVEVKVSKPSRFWNSGATSRSAHPDDVMDKLRMMKAS